MTTPPPQPAVKVPLLDLTRQYEQIGPEVRAAIERVCASQQFILGAQVRELEQRVARYTQCEYGIGASSGTDALLLALMTLGIGPGDEVITTPFTFFATAGVIARVGARPLFCDIDPVTYNLSPAALDELIDKHCEVRGQGREREVIHRRTGGRVRALMPVHLYGQLCDMSAIMERARELRLKVIEDAAQAIGAEDNERRMAGGIGHIGCFSFFPTKNLGAFGDAGMCVTNDRALAERMEVLRVHGAKPKYHHAFIGGNFRLDELQAAVLNVKLGYLEEWMRLRDGHAQRYTELLEERFPRGGVVTPSTRHIGRHVWNQYVIRARDRDELRQHMADAGVGTEIYYPIPLHLQQCFAYLGHRPGDLPQAELAAREVLALPVFPELTKTQVEYVVATIESFYKPANATSAPQR